MCKSQNCLQLKHSQHTQSGTNWLWSTLTVAITIKLDRIRTYPAVEARITNGVVCSMSLSTEEQLCQCAIVDKSE